METSNSGKPKVRMTWYFLLAIRSVIVYIKIFDRNYPYNKSGQNCFSTLRYNRKEILNEVLYVAETIYIYIYIYS